MSKELSNKDLFDAINEFSSATDKHFTKIESIMVTKDHLDDKIADLRGDLVVLVRKEDSKVKKLIDILTKKKVISQDDAKQINSMEPFPQLSL